MGEVARASALQVVEEMDVDEEEEEGDREDEDGGEEVRTATNGRARGKKGKVVRKRWRERFKLVGLDGR